MVSLESEFESAKSEHKLNILKFMIADYYLSAGVSIEEALLLADKHIKNLLLNNDIEQFNKLYDKAYNTLAPLLPQLDERRLYVRM